MSQSNSQARTVQHVSLALWDRAFSAGYSCKLAGYSQEHAALAAGFFAMGAGYQSLQVAFADGYAVADMPKN